MYLSTLRYEQIPIARREKICFLDFVPSKLGCPISRGCILPPLNYGRISDQSAETITCPGGRMEYYHHYGVLLSLSWSPLPNVLSIEKEFDETDFTDNFSNPWLQELYLKSPRLHVLPQIEKKKVEKTFCIRSRLRCNVRCNDCLYLVTYHDHDVAVPAY